MLPRDSQRLPETPRDSMLIKTTSIFNPNLSEGRGKGRGHLALPIPELKEILPRYRYDGLTNVFIY